MEHRVEVDGRGVAVITLDRPERLNALSPQGFAELADTLAPLAADPAVRGIVLTGSGRAFCAGADLGALEAMLGTDPGGGIAPEHTRDLFDSSVNPALRAFSRMEKPIVCAVNGIASGGGVGLALAGDVTLASPAAAFHLPFVPQLGILPDGGASWFVTRALGRQRALAVMLTGARISAEQSLDWGLVWRIEPAETLLDAACELASRLGAQPTAVLPCLRQAVDHAGSQTLDAQLDFERDANIMLCTALDFIEGVSAFLGKSKPDFRKGDMRGVV